MLEKIAWYREVLEFEPASKVFLPLAKLLMAQNEPAQALAVLRKGLAARPEHAEARLLLVDCLAALNLDREARDEAKGFMAVLASRPVVWRAWIESLAEDNAPFETILAARVLAARLEGKSLDWAKVLADGLALQLGRPVAEAARVAASVESSLAAPASEDRTAQTESPVRPEVQKPPVQAVADAESELAPAEDSDAALEIPRPLPGAEEAKHFGFGKKTPTPVRVETPAAAETLAVETPPRSLSVEAKPDAAEEDVDLDFEETVSLRTRTMADLLAEQGDAQGALDIYNELLSQAAPGQERDQLDRIIERLQAQIDLKPQDKLDRRKAKPDREAPAAKKYLGVLELLAKRMEARAVG